MSGLIVISEDLGEGVCNCWANLTLPWVDTPIGEEGIVSGLTRDFWNGSDPGYVVPTLRALLIMAKAHGLDRAKCARCRFSYELYPYLFFPEEHCLCISRELCV